MREAVEHIGGLVRLLQVSDAKLRTRFYEEVGVLGTYLPDARSVDIETDPCVRKVRVGGPAGGVAERSTLAYCAEVNPEVSPEACWTQENHGHDPRPRGGA